MDPNAWKECIQVAMLTFFSYVVPFTWGQLRGEKEPTGLFVGEGRGYTEESLRT